MKDLFAAIGTMACVGVVIVGLFFGTSFVLNTNSDRAVLRKALEAQGERMSAINDVIDRINNTLSQHERRIRECEKREDDQAERIKFLYSK